MGRLTVRRARVSTTRARRFSPNPIFDQAVKAASPSTRRTLKQSGLLP